ncbi:MAG: peptidylprolyl isomerase [Rhizobiaceae bacterium]|nr:peptidylprolyl isomerase [Rhizobiaceae bacterium]
MTAIGHSLVRAAAAVMIALAPLTLTSAPASASEIKYVVNGVPVTSYDIQRRAAFLKLQGRKNAGKAAADEMVEQALKQKEVERLGIKISDKAVDDSFARFAGSNKMSAKQMSSILAQAGVTAEHFKDFIRVQMGWNQALGARFRSTGIISEQDAVRRMLQQGGTKPTATEYMLQQVIFVVPAAERGALLSRRKKEAEAMRQRFSGCDSTRQFAKGLVDVTVRDLGRKIEQELPQEWADSIKSTQAGSATQVRETANGVEFIGVCSSREVSDDRVAQMVFSSEGGIDKKAEELSTKYVAELREKARIVER